MAQKSRIIIIVIVSLIIAESGIAWILAPAASLANAAGGTITVSLVAGAYSLHKDSAGKTFIEMDGVDVTLPAPGDPKLPGRMALIALPPAAQVTNVTFEASELVELPGRYDVAAAGAEEREPTSDGTITAPGYAPRQWAYGSNDAFPGHVGEYMGQGQWRRYSFARVAFQPFSYRPLSGKLGAIESLTVTLAYEFPAPDSPVWAEAGRMAGDRVLDDIISNQLVNHEQALAWYDGGAATTQSVSAAPWNGNLGGYLIVVEDEAMASAVAGFAGWKETLGHRVETVTLNWIEENYTGLDRAEQVWNLLHDKYPAGEWGIRYVLLVGDLQVLPARRLHVDYVAAGGPVPSDHFYAKLSGGRSSLEVWNKDGDHLWGELDDDGIDLEPDVLVGRIPLNDPAQVTAALEAAMRFEQSRGDWKRDALLAAGYYSVGTAETKQDGAVVAEYIRRELLEANGWSYSRLYEQSGLGTSRYDLPPDADTSPDNVVEAWNARGRGFTMLVDHGNPTGLFGKVWKMDGDNDGNSEGDEYEVASTVLFKKHNVRSLDTLYPSIVALMGCSTTRLYEPPTQEKAGGYTDNVGTELLAYGAAAGVVGFSSPVPTSAAKWQAPDDGEILTMGYYFAENLIEGGESLGWSVYEAKIGYRNRFWGNGYQPFHWAFTLFGDPSLALEGAAEVPEAQ